MTENQLFSFELFQNALQNTNNQENQEQIIQTLTQKDIESIINLKDDLYRNYSNHDKIIQDFNDTNPRLANFTRLDAESQKRFFQALQLMMSLDTEYHIYTVKTVEKLLDLDNKDVPFDFMDFITEPFYTKQLQHFESLTDKDLEALIKCGSDLMLAKTVDSDFTNLLETFAQNNPRLAGFTKLDLESYDKFFTKLFNLPKVPKIWDSMINKLQEKIKNSDKKSKKSLEKKLKKYSKFQQSFNIFLNALQEQGFFKKNTKILKYLNSLTKAIKQKEDLEKQKYHAEAALQKQNSAKLDALNNISDWFKIVMHKSQKSLSSMIQIDEQNNIKLIQSHPVFNPLNSDHISGLVEKLQLDLIKFPDIVQKIKDLLEIEQTINAINERVEKLVKGHNDSSENHHISPIQNEIKAETIEYSNNITKQERLIEEMKSLIDTRHKELETSNSITTYDINIEQNLKEISHQKKAVRTRNSRKSCKSKVAKTKQRIRRAEQKTRSKNTKQARRYRSCKRSTRRSRSYITRNSNTNI